MRLLILIFWALLAVATPAFAASEPIIAPRPEWVQGIDIPAPNAALRDRQAQLLLTSSQSLYGTEHSDHYVEFAVLVQTVEGLQSAGNVNLAWQQENSDLIVHKVQILRGSTVIDLLAQGHEFAVLRRENNLEAAMLDGTLTAVMQAEGLSIGDVLNVAFTLRRRPGALGHGGENLFLLPHGNPVGRFHVRQIWPQSLPIQWRGHDRLAEPTVRRTELGTELVLDLRNAEGPRPPEQAPARFSLTAMLQLTAFRDWAELSALVAPHYDRASAPSPDSPLRAEIDRIAALSNDPRARTLAALRRVQDEIRYFAMVIGDGNYLPATADQTWTRRYGDCKGKTVTLIALLRGLGIEAEPMLVNSQVGDLLPGRLPQLGMFDHVIVRVKIDGRSYWLDGTRTGDRNLEELAASNFGWGLAIRSQGAQLEEIPFAPASHPLAETRTTYDASSGLAQRVPFTIEQIYRGDFATMMRTAISQVGRDTFLQQARQDDFFGEDLEIREADIRDDPENGTLTLTASGDAQMDWQRVPGSTSRRFQFTSDTIDWDVDFDRADGPLDDAPFALRVPTYLASTETIILPENRSGFTIDGENFERTVAGTRIGRQVRMADGRAVARLIFQRIAREMPASEAERSGEAIREINEDEAYLIAPMGIAIADAEEEGDDASAPTPDELIESGYRKMDGGQMDEALADFDRAIELAPDLGRAYANRGVALIHLGRFDEAAIALANAMRRDPADFVVHQGYGMLHLAQGHPEDAIASLSRSLELDSNNSFTLTRRSVAHELTGDLAKALADIDRMIAADPENGFGRLRRATLLARMGRFDEGVAAMNAAGLANPTDVRVEALRGDLLLRMGRVEEARLAYGAALEHFDSQLRARDVPEDGWFMPIRLRLLIRAGRADEARGAVEQRLRRYPGNFRALTARCWIRLEEEAEPSRALRDCNDALEYDSGFSDALLARAIAYLRMERWADATADLDQVLELEPVNAVARFGRGLARLRAGDRARGEADLAAARQAHFTIDWEFENFGLMREPPL